MSVKMTYDFKEIVGINVRMLQFSGNFYPDVWSFENTFWYMIRSLLWLVSEDLHSELKVSEIKGAERNEKYRKKKVAKMRSTSGFFFGGIVIAELVNLIKSYGDIEKMTSASFLTLTNLLTIAKFYSLFKNQANIMRMIEDIDRPEFQPRSDYQRKILDYYVRLNKTVLFCFFGACFSTCMLWVVYPFTVDVLEDGTRGLMIDAWSPINTNTTFKYILVFSYEFIATVFGGFSNFLVDCLMSGFLMVLCAQLELLNDTLRNLKYFAEQELSNSTIEDSWSTAVENLMNKKLIECVVHHRYIIKFKNENEALFTYIIFGQFVLSIFINCTTLFQMSVVDSIGLRLFSLMFYQCCMFTELLLFCYSGNEVIVKSSQLLSSAYHCEWNDTSTKFRKNLIYFMTRTQVVMNTYVGNYFTMSIESYFKILKSSWSYYALLAQVNGKHKN